MIAMQVTDDERDAVLMMRRMREAGEFDAEPTHRESAVYVDLISARAELCIEAIRQTSNTMRQRREAMLNLLGPFVVMELCRAWHWKRQRLDEDAERDLVEGVA